MHDFHHDQLFRDTFDLGITKENFSKDKIKVEGTIGERRAGHQVYHLYCVHCSKILPRILNQPQYGDAKDLEDLIARWDEIGMTESHSEFVGCFISLDDSVHSGRYIHFITGLHLHLTLPYLIVGEVN